jgi:FlaA1/EpsC-like NDP-sugar epimerase
MRVRVSLRNSVGELFQSHRATSPRANSEAGMNFNPPYYSDPLLDKIASGRDRSLFDQDMSARSSELSGQIEGRRVLVVGGAGTIGAATTSLLLAYKPAAVHVVDAAENGLAELTRDLRSRTGPAITAELRFLPLDFGSASMERVLRSERGYDLVLNFAAQKHVRSEKDLPSLLHLLDTNVVKTRRLLAWLARYGHTARCFCVSTDKAANPSSLMGASKRLMEQVLFAAADKLVGATTARFANVAFSNGSLLQSFLIRVSRRQPLAVPRDTRRYFISAEEAAQICLLAAVIAPTSFIVFPRLDPGQHLRPLLDIARGTLGYLGFQPALYDDPEAARNCVAKEIERGRYPVLVTELDTSGEKSYEEFVAVGETVSEIGMATLGGVRHEGPPAEELDHVLTFLEQAVSDASAALAKTDVVAMLTRVIPGFQHVETGRSLDDRI